MKLRSRHDYEASLFDDVVPMSPEEINNMLGLADDEIIIDLFAGGGGASEGIEWATGRSPDEAINHKASAIAIHEANHPKTRHWRTDIWEADPVLVASGRRVGLLWLSPDCTHFSRAKGGRPVSKKIRVLAHVAVRYAAAVRPRVIMLENVPEFLSWGPISRETGKPDPRRKRHSFRRFVNQLRRLGYQVEWRTLRGCDYGAPTTRERLFLIARCDAAPIRWPKPTHGEGLLPYRTAADCIDFSLPCPSIFLTTEEARELGKQLGRRVKRPLEVKTLRRIARGVYLFVIDAAEPYVIVHMQHENKPGSVFDPLQTITTQQNKFNLIAPVLVPRYGEDPHRNAGAGQAPRTRSVEHPFPTIVPTGNGAQLVSAFLAKHYGDRGQRPGSGMAEPISTITPHDHHSVVTSSLVKLKGTCRDGHPVTDPLPTIQAQGNHLYEVRTFLTTYYGTNAGQGGDVRKPLRTLTPKDRLALVAVGSVDYVIVDIGMRTLIARELANGQGFGPDYILDGWYEVERRGKIVRKRITETSRRKWSATR